MDDKIGVIIAVTILGIASLYVQVNNKTGIVVDTSLLTQIVTGLFGIAVGRASLALRKEPKKEPKKNA